MQDPPSVQRIADLKPMKSVYFIRHGETEFNKTGKWSGTTDLPLTDLGHEQAQKAGALLAQNDIKFDSIVSSPLTRARQTAEHIAEALNYPKESIIFKHELVERHFGELEGQPFPSELMDNYKKDEAAIDHIEGVEEYENMHFRAQAVLDFVKDLPGSTILLVGHGSFARALKRNVDNDPSRDVSHRLENCEIIRLI